MIREILILLAVLCTHVGVLAQPVTYSYTWYNTQNIGLSHNTVTGMALDQAGFLWVGTIDGLNRFDGKSVKIFRHVAGDSTSISNNFIHGILADDDGTLWIGTRDGGINKFDPKTEKFTAFQFSDGIKNGIPNAPVYLFIKDREGTFWASIGSEAFGIFKPVAGQFRSAQVVERISGSKLNSPNAVVEFNDGSLLGAAYAGLYYIPAKEVKAFKSDTTKRVIYAKKIKGLK